MGMAVYATQAKRVTDEMFLLAARTLAGQVDDASLAKGLIYPPQSQILASSTKIAEKLVAYIFDHDLAGVPRPDDIAALIDARRYKPEYRL